MPKSIAEIVGGALSGAGSSASKAGGKSKSPVAAAVAGVRSIAPAVRQGSVSSGSVPASSYGGRYSQYAPASTASAAAKAAKAAKVQARRQQQAKQSSQARAKVAKQRKARSGQTLKTARAVSKGLTRVAKVAVRPKAPTIPRAKGIISVGVNGTKVAVPPSMQRIPFPPNTENRAAAPKVRVAVKPHKVAVRLQKAVSRAKPTFGGLDSEQSKVLGTVLKQGTKAGAPRKTMLSAVETGLVESNLRNLDYGDADSRGWRQERSIYYPNPTNVKASAKRYFSEAAAAKTKGQTPGQLAQATQQSAFPRRYDEVAPQAKPLLNDYLGTSKGLVPKKLERTAKQTIGRAPTKAILRGGKVVKEAQDKPSKADQRWGGSVGAIRAVVPKQYWPEMWGDKRTPEENADLPGAAADSDHLTTNLNSFGADLPADDALAKQIADNLGLGSHTGTQTVEKDGVRYQLIWQDTGHYDHIHLGAEITDASSAPFASDPNIPIKGTKFAVQPPTPTTSTSTAASTAGSTAGSTATSGSTATAGSTVGPSTARKKGRARVRRPAYSPYADAEGGYYSINPDDYQADPFLARLAELASA